jgi:hypothetical protein
MSVRDAMPDYVKKVYREVELEQEINGGAFLDLKAINKMLTPDRAVQIIKNEKLSDGDLIDDLNFNSVVLEREIKKAILRAKKLKTEKVEVKKTTPKKPDANDVIRSILHGGVRGYEALKKVMVCGL